MMLKNQVKHTQSSEIVHCADPCYVNWVTLDRFLPALEGSLNIMFFILVCQIPYISLISV